MQLRKQGPSAWPDITANEATVHHTTTAMIFMAVLLQVAGLAAIVNMPWGGYAAAAATIVVVLAAFWANSALFGSMRATHVGTNFVLAAIILTLLWYGYRKQAPAP